MPSDTSLAGAHHDREPTVEELKRELAESHRREAATGEVLKLVRNSATDLQPALDAIAAKALDLCCALTGSVLTFDGQLIHVAAANSFSPEALAFMHQSFPMLPSRGGATAHAILSKATAYVPDVFEDSEYQFRAAASVVGYRSILSVPMLSDGRPIGAITVTAAESRAFSPKLIELLQIFADQAVIAIENTRLFEAEQTRTKELRESLEYQTAISEVLSVISRAPGDVQPVFDAIVSIARNLCEAERAVVWRIEGEDFRPIAFSGMDASGIDKIAHHRLPVGGGSVLGRAAEKRAAVQVLDAASDTSLSPRQNELARAGNIRSILAVPLIRDGRPMGCLSVSRTVVQGFAEKQVALLETFADQAVIAIENARLFEAEQARTRELTEALDRQTATSEVLSVISTSPGELEPIFQTMLQSAVRICEASFGNLYLCEGDGFRFVSIQSAPPAYREWLRLRDPYARWWTTHTSAKPPLARAIRTKQTQHVADARSERAYIERDPPFVALVDLAGARTLLVVPMLTENEPVGAIAIYRQEVRPFTDKQIELVKSFASQAVIAIDNTRLLTELRESLQQQTATADVLKVISRSALDLQRVLDALVESATHLCNAYDAAILQVFGDGLRLVAHHGQIPTPGPVGTATTPLVRGNIGGRAVLERRTIQVVDIQAEADEYPDSWRFGLELGYRTTLCVPLVHAGEAIGIILIRRAEVRPFTERQIELVNTFADQAVIAIENTRLFEEVQARTRELQDSLEYQTATSNVLNVISRSPTDVQPVFDTIAKNAAQLCGAPLCNVFQFDGQIIHIAASQSPDAHGVTLEALEANANQPAIQPGRGSAAARAIATNSLAEIPDIDADPEYELVDIARVAKLGSTMAVPMLKDGRPIGAIALGRFQKGRFPERQIELLRTFADQAVIAVANTRLFEEVQARNTELRVALEQQTATSELLKVIGRSTFDLQPVFETLAENAVRLCEAEHAFIFLYDGRLLRSVASHNIPPALRAFVEANPTRPGRESAAGRAAIERRTIHIEDIRSDPEFTYGVVHVGPMRTVLAIPMLRADELLGVIVITRPEVRLFTNSQIALMETFADQAVIAIENARLFAEVQARNRDLTALGEVGQAVSSTLDLKVVLKTIVDRAVELSGTDGGSIFYYRGGRFELGETTGLNEEAIARFRQLDIAEGQTGLGEAIAQRQPLQVPDIFQRPSNPLRDASIEAGLRAGLVVPLFGSEGPLGALVLQRRRPGEFPPAVVSLMQAFADQSAIALENARLFNEIAQKSRELEIASQHKSQFVANMSHELRTPLAAVLGYAELMQEGFYEPQGPKSLDALTRISSNGKHLLGLINTVLDIAKIESGQFTLNMAEYAIESVVETVRAATESLAQNKKLELKTDVARPLPIGIGDEQRLTQVLLNLVGNAIKFTDAGEVRVVAKAINGHFAVSVADTGPGIPEHERSRIFEQFHQIDSSNTKTKGGTGLGLAITKQIVEMHGGRIWVESALGKGSTFLMELPTGAEFRKIAP